MYYSCYNSYEYDYDYDYDYEYYCHDFHPGASLLAPTSSVASTKLPSKSSARLRTKFRSETYSETCRTCSSHYDADEKEDNDNDKS